jgi:hypothetical protein
MTLFKPGYSFAGSVTVSRGGKTFPNLTGDSLHITVTFPPAGP